MKDKELLFSVIVPVYNGEKYLPGCLDSLLAQTWENFEILLIDDGSSDRSGGICDEYQQCNPEQVRAFHITNHGVSYARNLGIENARGEFLSFVDCDDTVRPAFLQCFERMISGYENVDLAVCGVEQNGKNLVLNGSRKKDGLLDTSRLKEELMRSDSIWGFVFNKVFRNQIVQEQNIRFDTELHMCEDLLFCIQYAQNVRAAVLDNAPNYVYFYNPEGAAHSAFNPKLISAIETYQKICGLISPRDGAAAERLARRGIYYSYVNVFLMLRSREDYGTVRREAGAYIRNHVSVIFWPEVAWKQKVKALLACALTFFKGMR